MQKSEKTSQKLSAYFGEKRLKRGESARQLSCNEDKDGKWKRGLCKTNNQRKKREGGEKERGMRAKGKTKENYQSLVQRSKVANSGGEWEKAGTSKQKEPKRPDGEKKQERI